MSLSRSRRRPLSYYSGILNAARNGSANDIQALLTDLREVPDDLVQDVLGIFLSHLDVRKFAAYKENPVLRIRYSLAYTSLKGLHVLFELGKFLSCPFIPKTLLDSWRGIFDCIRLFYADALEEGNDAIASLLANYFVHIFHIFTITGSERSLCIFADPEFQTFVSNLWLRGSEVEDGCSNLLLYCLKSPAGMDPLIKAAARTGNPSGRIAKIAVDKLNHSLKVAHKETTKPFSFMSVNCLAFVCFSENREHGMIQALVDSGGISSMLRVLQQCRKALLSCKIPEDRSIFTVPGSCFTFLSFCFREVDSNFLGKVLRNGLLDVVLDLSPWAEQMEVELPGVLRDLRYILSAAIPQELVCSDSINLLTNYIRSVTAEQRQRMSKSVLGVYWNELEALCVERLAMSEVSATLRRSSRCDRCKKWDLKSQLKACGRCRKAIYCSRACQTKDWKSSVKAHRDNCTPRDTKAALTKSIRRADITADLALRDVSRYYKRFWKAKVDFHGPFVPEHFQQLNSVIVLNYLVHPLEIEILDISEVLMQYHGISGNVDFWLREVICAKGNGVFCLRLFKGPTGRTHHLSLVDLGTMWATVPPRSPRQWESGLQSAICRRRQSDDLHLKPEIDALENILSHCGSTVDEFSLSDFSERMFAWLKRSMQLARR